MPGPKPFGGDDEHDPPTPILEIWFRKLDQRYPNARSNLRRGFFLVLLILGLLVILLALFLRMMFK